MVSHMADLSIILGVPASGKTTLARLAADLSLRRAAAEIVRRFTQRKRHAGHLDPSGPQSEIESAAALPSAFLDLPGVRLVHSSDSRTAYGELIQSLKSEAL
jgi:hypothetical protein